ncbi:MAG: AEC family transporter [Synergistaceae bacterium]|jgi:predicted permease|nr:AEC family transporter [Synergistaceae bacterium]
MKGAMIIAPLVAVVVLGMILRGRGFFSEADRDRFTKLLYWVTLPALLFRTVYLSGNDLTQHKNLFFVLYSSFLIVPAIGLVLSYLLNPNDRRVYSFTAMASMRSNCFYLGIPAASLALGEPGVIAASTFLAIGLPGYNLLSVLWGEAVMSGGLSPGTVRKAGVRAFKNPLIVSSLLGLLAAQAEITIPLTVLEALKLIGDMATGIALFALGMGLELSNLRGAFRRTWLEVLMKLIINPAVVWALFLAWPAQETLFQTSIIISAMPTAVNAFIVARGMGMDERYASETVAVTTILAPLAISVWVSLLGIS